ncbi:hypothetical protein FOA52_014113 [Chlamydomonas sp. UWO 241]|nr:hypothetical protein FOA52_014113 [Chlamydomonas sp. UWO 241]
MSAIIRIKEIEDEMARTQKNKATSGHLGSLKAKLAKLRREILEPKGGGGGGGGDGFDVNKVGDARVGFVGFPSVGKSTLLTKLTGTFSEAANYEFTTLTCIPGIVRYRGARIQFLDLPGIIEGAKDGKGRGRQVISTARTCDLILIVLDCLKPLTHKRIIEKELEGFGIRLNKKPPSITFKKKDKGGINFSSVIKEPIVDLEGAKAVCAEYRIFNADIFMAEDYEIDDLVDVIEGSRVYIPAIYAVNKIDQCVAVPLPCALMKRLPGGALPQITLEELNVMDRLPHYCPICAFHEWNLDGLVEMCWDYLDLVRVYTKPKGKLPDFNEPVVMHRGQCTVEDFCNKIHKNFIKQFKYALLWGQSAKHRPQRVGKDHIMMDEDIVQIVKKV